MKKLLSLSLATVSVLVIAFAIQFGIYHFADATVTGWLWGGSEEANDQTIDGNETGLGWISVSSTNCDTDGDGTQNTDTCPGNADPVSSYQLSIPESDGNVTGYAWSENIGWIDFDPAGPYPGTPDQSAYQEGDWLKGWARISGIATEAANSNSGGWQGWIKLSGTAQDGTDYGINLNDLSNNAYAWSDELGWIDFSQISNSSDTTGVALTATPSQVSLAEGETLSEQTTLDWTISGISPSYCTASGGHWADTDANKSTTGGSESVTVDMSPTIFQLECFDSADNLVGSDSVQVNAYCNANNCDDSDSCSLSSFFLTGSACSDQCTTSADCGGSDSGSGSWREIAP